MQKHTARAKDAAKDGLVLLQATLTVDAFEIHTLVPAQPDMPLQYMQFHRRSPIQFQFLM